MERKKEKNINVQRCLRWNWYIDEVLCSRKGKGGGYVWGDEGWRENCDDGKWFGFVLIKKLINYLTEIIICTIFRKLNWIDKCTKTLFLNQYLIVLT